MLDNYHKIFIGISTFMLVPLCVKIYKTFYSVVNFYINTKSCIMKHFVAYNSNMKHFVQ